MLASVSTGVGIIGVLLTAAELFGSLVPLGACMPPPVSFLADCLMHPPRHIAAIPSTNAEYVFGRMSSDNQA
jgi:hypothetical protein